MKDSLNKSKKQLGHVLTKRGKVKKLIIQRISFKS
jgi:hypothetical protein